MLGDSHLDPTENVHKLRELCLKDAAKNRIPNQAELEDPDRQRGPRLPHGKLLAKLQALAPQLTARDGSPGDVALYFPRRPDELGDAIREGAGLATNDPEFFLFNKYVGGFPKEELPEYGYVDLDTSLLATHEHLRSWRTVVIGLIKAGVIAYNVAIREFGDPTLDPRSARWFRETNDWRIKSPNEARTRSQLA